MEELKKIIFTVTNDISYDQRMARICGTLADAGYDVEIVGRKRKKSIELQNRNYKQTRLNCFFDKGKLFYIEYNIRLFFYLLFTKSDIISSVDLDTLLPCFLVSNIRSKKLVFDAHEYFTEVPEVTNRKWVKLIWETVAKLCIRHVKAAYTVGQKLAEKFTEKYHKNFEVILNVPSSSPHPLIPSSQKRIILYQGALNEARGLEELIDAMHEIDAECWIAGEGDLSDVLRQKVLQLNLTEKIKFLGYVSPEELNKITAQAYIGINLLKPQGLSYYYSLSNKFFDYIQAGVPQVCVAFPEYESINVQHQVAVLCHCEVAEIVQSINNLLNDEILYEKLKKECSVAKEIFNWENEKNKLLKIYAEVAG